MQAVAADQGAETAEAQAPTKRRRINSNTLDMATRGYLRGQVPLEEFTRLFDEFLEAVDRREHTERSHPGLPDATARLARWMKHALSALSDRSQTKNRP